MRALVDIPKEDLSLLDKLGKAGGKSRAELVRQAISAYLHPYRRTKRIEGFGLWANRRVDGLVYQDKLRSEWKP